MRKVISLRLSDEARQRLNEMMTEQKLSAGLVVERLILRDPPEVVSVESSKLSPGGTSVEFVKPRIQDISATKKVRPGRLEHPIRTTTTSRPQQGRTTLTGKPFGPIPKGK